MKVGFSFLVIFFLVAVSFAAAPTDSTPSQKEKCFVCGMFVATFADQNARIQFKDSTHAIFCGTNCMCKYYLNMSKYNPSKSKNDVTGISVKDFHSAASIDAQKAFYVIGSDVYGPMGHEPIPFEKETDAKKFLQEHKGKNILRFKEINLSLIKNLDNP